MSDLGRVAGRGSWEEKVKGWFLSAALGIALFAGCSESDDGWAERPNADASTGGSGGTQVCTPGQQVACACPGGDTGAQRCRDDGSGYETCICVDAGSDGDGGAAGHSEAGSDGDGGAAGHSDAGLDASAGTAGASGDAGTGGTPADASQDSDADSAACVYDTIPAAHVQANVLYVLDRSETMNCNAPPIQTTAQCESTPAKVDPTSPSKWELTRDALLASWDALESDSPLPSVGLAFFNNDDGCGFPSTPDVPVQPLSDPQHNALVLHAQAVTPMGSSPIIGATLFGYQYLYTNAALFPGLRLVVLLTDGTETCDLEPGVEDFFVTKAEEARGIGIRTIVLGAPGSEVGRAFLSRIAFAGGTASDPTCDHSGSAPDVGDCHRDMTLPGMDYGSELSQHLAEVIHREVACELALPDGPLDLNAINVEISPSSGAPYTIPRDDTVPCSDATNSGWQLTVDHARVVLCGQACEAIRADPYATASFQIGCLTITANP